jgi:hypothetical protein
METPYASQYEISKLRASADIIEELAADEGGAIVTYLGFSKSPDTENTYEPYWSIMKITESSALPPKLTIFQWATGLCSYNLIWDNRGDYDYTFKKF